MFYDLNILLIFSNCDYKYLGLQTARTPYYGKLK